MRGWKGACRNRLREERYHDLLSVRIGGGTVEACTKLRSPLDPVNSPCTPSIGPVASSATTQSKRISLPATHWIRSEVAQWLYRTSLVIRLRAIFPEMDRRATNQLAPRSYQRNLTPNWTYRGWFVLVKAIDALFNVPKAELVAVLLNCWRPNQNVFETLNTSARN